MQNRRVLDVKILVVAILLLLISDNAVGLEVCKYGSEKHGCTWNPLTWIDCWMGILMDMGNCVMMLFMNKMADFILMNPDITVFRPYINDIVSLLLTIYVLSIAITGIYIIFLSTEPEHRARAKMMMVKLIIGMGMVTMSLHIYELLLNLAEAIARQILASQGILAGGIGGIATLTILIAVSVVFFFISSWILPFLAVVALISIVFRYFAVCLMAVLFPLTLFFYFFEFTRGIGKNMMRYTMMAVFTQPVQALMMAIMVVGLNNAEVSGGGVMAIIIGVGGLIMIIAAPLMMLGLMKWVGGAVAGAGMMLAFKRPLFGAALVITGGVGTGMGPESFVAGGSAYVLGGAYTKHQPHKPKIRKHRVKKAFEWAARRETVKKTVSKFKQTRAGQKVTAGMKTIRANVDTAGDSLYKFNERVEAGWQRHKKTIGYSIFIPGYWIWAARGSRTGASINRMLANTRYAAAISAAKKAVNPDDVVKKVREIAGKDATRDLENILPNRDKLAKDVADAIKNTLRQMGARVPATIDAEADRIVNQYMRTLDARAFRDALRAKGLERKTIGSIFRDNRPRSLNQFKRRAEWFIRRDKAVKHDIKAVKNFKDLESINEKFNLWSEKDFRDMRTKAAKGEKKLKLEEIVKEMEKGKKKLNLEETVETIGDKAVKEVAEEVRKQVEDKFRISDKDYKNKVAQLMKDKGLSEADAQALIDKDFNDIVELNVEKMMKTAKMQQRVEENFWRSMKKLPEYRRVKRIVARDLKRSRRLPAGASDEDVRRAVDTEMKKMLEREIDVIKQEKTIPIRRGMSPEDAAKFKLKHKHGELRRSFDSSLEELPLSFKDRRNARISADANMAKDAISNARTADEVNAVLKGKRILTDELEAACMKAYGVSREDARDRMSRFLDTHKRSAELAVENRKNLLQSGGDALESIVRGIKLAGLALVPGPGIIIAAKVAAEARRPIVVGMKRTGLAIKTRMEGSRRGRWVLRRWDSGKRRAGRTFRGARIRAGGMRKEMRTRKLEKELSRQFTALGAPNPDGLAHRAVNAYRTTNDLSDAKTYLKNWYRAKYPTMPINVAEQNAANFVQMYDPGAPRQPLLRLNVRGAGQSLKNVGNKLDTFFFEIGGTELQEALSGRFEALDIPNPDNAAKNVVEKYRRTKNMADIEGELRNAYRSKYPTMAIDEVNRNVSDFISMHKPELKRVSLLTGKPEDVHKTLGWKLAYHTGLTLAVPFYTSYLTYAALAGRNIGAPMHLIAWTALKAGEKVKKSRAGRAVGDSVEGVREWAGDVSKSARDVKRRVKEKPREFLKERRTRRLEEELSGEFKTLGALDPDGLAHRAVDAYRTTNDLNAAKKELSAWYQHSHWTRHGTTMSVYEADIKAARFLEARDPERVSEPLMAKWKNELRSRDLGRMENELTDELRKQGVADADKIAGALVGDYDKSNDLWQINQALKRHGSKHRIPYFSDRYGPDRLGEPLHRRPGTSFRRAAERLAGMEEEVLARRRLTALDEKLSGEFKALGVPATDNAVKEIKNLVGDYTKDTTDKKLTEIKSKLAELYKDKGWMSLDDAEARAYGVLRGYSPDKLREPVVDARGKARWVKDHKRKVAKHVGLYVGLSLIIPPVAAPYLAKRGLYAGLGHAKTKLTLRNLEAIKVSDGQRYAKLRDSMVDAGVPEAEARVLIEDHIHNRNEEIKATPSYAPRKSELEYHDNLLKEAKAVVVAQRTMGKKYQELAGDFFKPFKPSKTLKGAIRRGGKYSIHGKNDPTLLDIERRAEADINNRVDTPEAIIRKANMEINDHLVESGSFNKYLRENVSRRYGLLDSEVDRINNHLTDSRRDKITDLRRQMKIAGEPPILNRNQVNAQVLVDAHRSVQEIASVEIIHHMKPSEQANYIDFYGGSWEVGEIRLLTEEEKAYIIFSLDLGSNLHIRMLLEDYMGIGPRPSEFYHGIGPETKEEREKEREREDESPLYQAATTKTAALGERILGGLDELRRAPEKGEKKE